MTIFVSLRIFFPLGSFGLLSLLIIQLKAFFFLLLLFFIFSIFIFFSPRVLTALLKISIWFFMLFTFASRTFKDIR